jgi:hypothetical protein
MLVFKKNWNKKQMKSRIEKIRIRCTISNNKSSTNREEILKRRDSINKEIKDLKILELKDTFSYGKGRLNQHHKE